MKPKIGATRTGIIIVDIINPKVWKCAICKAVALSSRHAGMNNVDIMLKEGNMIGCYHDRRTLKL